MPLGRSRTDTDRLAAKTAPAALPDAGMAAVDPAIAANRKNSLGACGGLRHKLARLGRAIVPLALTCACASAFAEEADKSGGFWGHGRIDLRYVFRTTSGSSAESDQDLVQDLFVEGGKGPVRVEASGRLHEDIDGKHAPVSVFRDMYDTYDEPVVGFLYTGYVELLDQGALERVRAGRQYYGNGVDVRFDGGLVETKPLADAVKLVAYGGIPADLYETSVRGDWLTGGAAELVALPRTTIRADYAHVIDYEASTVDLLLQAGLPRRVHVDDNLYSLSATHQLVPDWVRLYGRASTFDGRSSRIEGDVYLQWKAQDLTARLKYVTQQGSYRDLGIQFSPFDAQLGAYEPYHDFCGDVRKGLGRHFSLGAGGETRQLQHDSDQGFFNHEFNRAFVTGDMTDLPWEGLTVSLLGEWYLSDAADQTYQLSGDISQKIGDFIVGGGSSYARYQFNEFFLEERENVRAYYGSVEWRPVKWLRPRLQYSYENDDKEEYHVVRFDVRITF